MDVAYVIKNHDKKRAAFELQEHYTGEVKDSNWWHKDFYDKNDFHWKVIANYVQRLRSQIRAKSPKTVVDIGCANGGRLDILAEEFPGIQFVGLDFLVDEAIKHNRSANIKYLAGYIP